MNHTLPWIWQYYANLTAFGPNFGPNLDPRPIWPKVTIIPMGVVRHKGNISDGYPGHIPHFIAEESYITFDLALLHFFDFFGPNFGPNLSPQAHLANNNKHPWWCPQTFGVHISWIPCL